MLDEQPMRTSLKVAPLAISREQAEYLAQHNNDAMDTTSTHPYSHGRITPPATPSSSQEALVFEPPPPPPAVFHNFLRAFYEFKPSCDMNDSTVTLPLNEGDVVLVHSIHTNGWADGTLLISGARGWLPTNYCESYDPEEMRNLLKALLNFWDLLRSTATNDQDIFGNQEFMKGIIAGVRYLLERTHCLTRESPIIQRNDMLRKSRKNLLSDLSSLVKIAKQLSETLRRGLWHMEEVNNMIDEMILKAFKIIVRSVRFLDLLDEDRRMRAPMGMTIMATVAEESTVPPTPPADAIEFEKQQQQQQQAHESDREAGHVPMQVDAATTHTQSSDEAQANEAAGKRLSACPANVTTTGHRTSASISHRVSLAGPSSFQPQNLVSERLNASHDTLLSYLGSFLGRLHLQSQSRSELALAVKQSAVSGGQLLAVVSVVCDHSDVVDPVRHAREAMFDRIRDLVYTAQDVLTTGCPEYGDAIMPQDNTRLHGAATGCVKVAGECVGKSKWVLQRIGDFEFEQQDWTLDLDLSIFDRVAQETTSSGRTSPIATKASSTVSTPGHSVQSSIDKPLPNIPAPIEEMPEDRDSSNVSSRRTSCTEPMSVDEPETQPPSRVSSLRPSLPPLPRLTTTIPPEEPASPTENSHDEAEYHNSFRSDIMTASSCGTNSTYLSRDSESSIVSQTSTRATTPDSALAPKNQPSLSNLSSTGSAGTSEDVDEVESKLMEKTFIHELMLNKEQQVIGGSLPALIEQMTLHGTTPDATFVSTFYLTFRSFCSPSQFANLLIERFDYVGETPHTADSVRLRVFNVFKGWIESHWRESTDREALPIIEHFAEHKLIPVLPPAGKRLLELTKRVSASDGSLVPRLVSSMGKTSTSISQYVPADTPLPNPVLSRTAQQMLHNMKSGGTAPAITDFDALEFARQLTLKQMSIFCAIMPEELLGSQWMKKGGVDSPNVKAMSSFSTDLSNLVADTILHHPEAKKRAVVIKQWIKIADKCLELRNYDGLMAIICSLNSSVISRLRKTWDLISSKRRDVLRNLQAIVEPANNNKELRGRLQGHVPPCLPFLGMFLTDLTFVDIGNPATKQLQGACTDESALTVVNFDKHTRTARIIGELQRFQIPYRLLDIADMQDWIQDQIVRVKEADQSNVQREYYRKSLLLEPRESIPRTPVEAPPPSAAQKTDLFGWISRDRHNTTAAQ